MTEIYQLVVVDAGISPAYFFNRMQDFEVRAVLKRLGQNKRESLELYRTQVYYTIAPYLQKGKTPSQLMPFSWDKKQKQTKDKPFSNEQLLSSVGNLINRIK